jgi:peptidoglycan hydrolase CwlO-like protein
MTAPKDDIGRYQIDPAELFRVYPPKRLETGNENQSRLQEEPHETRVLEVKVEALRELLRQIESERDDLRERLDKSEDERRATQTKLTALLTSNQQQEAKPAPRPWWWWW